MEAVEKGQEKDYKGTQINFVGDLLWSQFHGDIHMSNLINFKLCIVYYVYYT